MRSVDPNSLGCCLWEPGSCSVFPNLVCLFPFDLPEGMPSRWEWEVGIFGIHEDWLAVIPSPFAQVDGEDFYLIFLYHPFSGQRIQLPMIPKYVPHTLSASTPRTGLRRLCFLARLRTQHASPPTIAIPVKALLLQCSRRCRRRSQFRSLVGGDSVQRDVLRRHCVLQRFHLRYDQRWSGALSVANISSSEITGQLPAPPTSGIPPQLERLVRWRCRLQRRRTFSIMVSGSDLLLMCCVVFFGSCAGCYL